MKNNILSVNYQLGARIRFLRKNRNLSIEDLALIADVNHNYLSDLERGERNPTINVLYKIAKALEIKLEVLFRGVGGE